MAKRKAKDISDHNKIDHKNKKEATKTYFWSDLPQDILVLIMINKLNDFADRVRFRAVCKNWRVPKEVIITRCSDSPPWITNYSWPKSKLTCELFRPYSQKVYKFPISMGKKPSSGPFHDVKDTTVYATKHGWSLAGGHSFLFLHNPYINKIIWLPILDFYCKAKAATFTKTPTTSPDCEVFVFWKRAYSEELHISKYCLSRSDRRKSYWSAQCLGITSDLLSVEYFKGDIYCLFRKHWGLKRYNLADKSWKSLTIDSPSLDYPPTPLLNSRHQCWLVEKGEDLVMACAKDAGRYIENWMIFRFDFSEMSWINIETSLTGCDFFISGEIAFSRPFADHPAIGKKIEEEDCKVYYFDDKRSHKFGMINGYRFNCFSFKEKKIKPINYSWIKKRIEEQPSPSFSFIHPPCIN